MSRRGYHIRWGFPHTPQLSCSGHRKCIGCGHRTELPPRLADCRTRRWRGRKKGRLPNSIDRSESGRFCRARPGTARRCRCCWRYMVSPDSSCHRGVRARRRTTRRCKRCWWHRDSPDSSCRQGAQRGRIGRCRCRSYRPYTDCRHRSSPGWPGRNRKRRATHQCRSLPPGDPACPRRLRRRSVHRCPERLRPPWRPCRHGCAHRPGHPGSQPAYCCRSLPKSRDRRPEAERAQEKWYSDWTWKGEGWSRGSERWRNKSRSPSRRFDRPVG